MPYNESNKNDSLKEIHTTFDSDGSIKTSEKKGSLLPKVLSVIAAIALWLYVFQAVEYEKTFNGIPIEIEENFDINSGLGIVSNHSMTVDVTLSGTKSVIDKISAEDIRAYVDMNNVTEADMYNRSVELDIPSSVDVVKMSVENLRIEVDRTVSDFVDDITVNSVYSIQSPLELGEITVLDMHSTPIEQFTITGPETDLVAVNNAVIDVDLGSVRNSVDLKVKSENAVKLYDISGNSIDTRYIKIEPSVVYIHVPVYKTRQVSVVPNLLMDNDMFEYETYVQNVDVFGITGDVDRIGVIRTVEASITEAGTYILALSIPENVSVYKSGTERNKNNEVMSVAVKVTEKKIQPAANSQTYYPIDVTE